MSRYAKYPLLRLHNYIALSGNSNKILAVKRVFGMEMINIKVSSFVIVNVCRVQASKNTQAVVGLAWVKLFGGKGEGGPSP